MNFNEAAEMAWRPISECLPEGAPICAICHKETSVMLHAEPRDRVIVIQVMCHGAEEIHRIDEKDIYLFKGSFQWELAFQETHGTLPSNTGAIEQVNTNERVRLCSSSNG